LNREVELKLSARAADLPALERALAEMTPDSVSMPERLIATYHDTRDLALQRRGLTLRVREQSGRFIDGRPDPQFVVPAKAGTQGFKRSIGSPGPPLSRGRR
jgi:CYTH domain